MSTEVREPSAKYLVGALYKHTEVGFIPKEWDVLALADIAAIERGKFSARPRNDPKYYGGEFPFIQTGDVTRSCGSISTFTQTLNREGVRVSRLFPEGTLFFTIAANIGDVGIAKFEAACPDSLVAIVPRSGVQKGWLLYELARKKSDFESLASPGAQLNINLEKLRPYLVPVPPEAEQSAIATALSDVDALIAGLEKLIAKKRDLKQAAMQQLLTGQTRLPGFRGEWVVKRLGDLANVAKGRGLSKGQLAGSGANPCILYGELFTTYERVISSVVSKTNSSEGLAGLRGDVLLPGSTTTKAIDLAVACALLADDVQLGGDINVVRMKGASSYDPIFMANLLTHTQKLAIADLAQGSTIIHLYGRALLNLKLKLPVITEQAAIATVLSDMDTEITSLESRLAKTHELKQGMMQELLTGRTRLV